MDAQQGLRKLRVLHIEDRFHPDYGYQINNLAARYGRSQDFHILTSTSFLSWHVEDPGAVFESRDPECEERLGVTTHRAKPLFEIESRVWMRGLAEHIQSINPDIIYVHGLESFSAARVLLSRLADEYPIVTDTHNLRNVSKRKFLRWLYYLVFRNTVVKVINRKKIPVFFTASENREMLMNDYGVESRNVYNFEIGTDPGKFCFDLDWRFRLRRRLRIPQSATMIIYTGKLDAIKEPHLILEAVKQIEHDLMQPLHLLFVGGRDATYFRNKMNVAFKNQHIFIHFLPFVASHELFKYYSAADLAVFPRFNTLSSLDAQANRLPVVMEDDTVNRARLKKGGLLYVAGDIRDLGAKIKALIVDPELRKQLGSDGHDFVRNHYNYSKAMAKVEELMVQRVMDFKKISRGLEDDLTGVEEARLVSIEK